MKAVLAMPTLARRRLIFPLVALIGFYAIADLFRLAGESGSATAGDQAISGWYSSVGTWAAVGWGAAVVLAIAGKARAKWILIFAVLIAVAAVLVIAPVQRRQAQTSYDRYCSAMPAGFQVCDPPK